MVDFSRFSKPDDSGHVKKWAEYAFYAGSLSLLDGLEQEGLVDSGDPDIKEIKMRLTQRTLFLRELAKED